MKTSNIYALLLFTAVSLLTACKKDDTNTPGTGTKNDPTTPVNSLKVARVDQDANNYSTYAYNTDGLLTTLITVHNQVSTTSATTYDANKQASSVTIGDEIYKPVYTDGRISRINIYEKQNPQLPSAYFTYSYNAGKVSEADYYSVDEQQAATLSVKATSVYNAAGDVSTRKMYYLTPGGLMLASTANYEYDTQVNPLSASFEITGLLLGSPAVHNITKQTLLDAAGNINETDIYAITYNSNHYPVQISCQTVKPGKADVTTVSKFTYK